MNERESHESSICERFDDTDCTNFYNCCDCGIRDGDFQCCYYCFTCNACDPCYNDVMQD